MPRKIFPNIIRRLFRLLTWLLDYFISKDPRLVICLAQEKEWSGNSKAIYDYLNRSDCELRVFRYQRAANPKPEDAQCLAGWWRWKTFWTLLRAKTVISTHGLAVDPYKFSNKKLYVETWHGVPLKGQRYTEASMTKKDAERGIKYWENVVDVFIAPSRMSAYAMCVSCGMNPRKVFYCGQARNDQLINMPHGNGALAEIIPSSIVYDKVILYAPTYRRNVPIRFFPFKEFLSAELNAFLEENNAVLFTRGHTVGISSGPETTSQRIITLDQEQCPDVQAVLAEVSMLITDYSSIFIDYLLLDRPIIFVPYDLDQYASECGFVVDDYEFWTPGPKISDFQGFLDAMRIGLAGEDDYKQQRRMINRLWNYYEDGKSCEKIVAMLCHKLLHEETS